MKATPFFLFVSTFTGAGRQYVAAAMYLQEMGMTVSMVAWSTQENRMLRKQPGSHFDMIDCVFSCFFSIISPPTLRAMIQFDDLFLF